MSITLTWVRPPPSLTREADAAHAPCLAATAARMSELLGGRICRERRAATMAEPDRPLRPAPSDAHRGRGMASNESILGASTSVGGHRAHGPHAAPLPGPDGPLLGLMCLKRHHRGFCSDADVASRADAGTAEGSVDTCSVRRRDPRWKDVDMPAAHPTEFVRTSSRSPVVARRRSRKWPRTSGSPRRVCGTGFVSPTSRTATGRACPRQRTRSCARPRTRSGSWSRRTRSYAELRRTCPRPT